MKREKGKHVSLGIDTAPMLRSIGIRELSYAEITEIFSFLDSTTVLRLHSAAKDVTIFRKTGPKNCKYAHLYTLTQFNYLESEMAFRGTPSVRLPEYLKMPLYAAVSTNLMKFKAELEAVPRKKFLTDL